ncbi:ABC transporter permease subunit [Niameybacter massiliensis]|uniref:ABC transporter permease subunit n=1 Tax=Holtiella tumoricola TaxID=3018743 RepID=A0AA42J2S5_9FIRM|nr:ABC transporter permease subunit [Holtiella tumoricola]MDA3734074.1 ABC transporter permease subunit [Holtiella tumoricola]
MALPALIIMMLFKYLPMAGIMLAFKKFSVRKGIFGSDWIGLDNFEFLFKSSDAFIITRNTICYNVIFIILDLMIAVALAIALNELLNKRRAKVFQTIFMAPYFLSWVVVSFVAYAFFSMDDGFINHLLLNLGLQPINWYNDKTYWPYILVFFQIWKTVGYSTVMYLGCLTGISNEYYEAALMDGASKWQQIKYITLPFLKPMMIVLTILAIGKIFYSDFGLFYQLPRNSGPLFSVTNVIDTYVYRALKETGNIGMASAASLYQSVVGFVLVIGANLIVRRVDKDSALF